MIPVRSAPRAADSATAHYNLPMTTLIIALPAHPPTVATEFAFVLSSLARPLMDHGTAPLALLPGADVLVLVAPARALSWHRVRLPPVSGGRVRAALAGLLEDQLLDDPAQLGFALVPGRTTEGEVRVAVFDKAWMRATLDFFEQGQRPAHRVVPEFAPLAPDAPSTQLDVIGTPDNASLVLIGAHGVTCLPLASAAAAFADKSIPVVDDLVSADPAVADLAEQLLGRTVALQPAPQRLLQASRCEWELAQFELAISGGSRFARRRQQQAREWMFAPAWRLARWGLVGLVLANLVGIQAWAWKLDAAVRDKQQHINGLLTQTFPTVRTIVDAPLQMQRELVLLRQSSGAVTAADMETMLAAVGAAWPHGVQPVAIDFAPGELALRGPELSAPQHEQLRNALQSQGYTVQFDKSRWVVRQRSQP